MAIGIYFAPSMTIGQYADAVQRLKKAGAGHPKGRRCHACFGEADKVQVFDVWDSQATLDRFSQTLMPVLAELGVTPAQPMVMPIHSIIVPPKKAATRRAARKPARAKASKTSKTRRGRK